MTIYSLKPQFQKLLIPIVDLLGKRGVTPNQVTLFALVLSMGFGVALFLTKSVFLMFMLPLFLFIRMALNAIDGVLAKRFNLQSELGRVLNELSDVVSDVFLYLPFAFITGEFLLISLFIFVGIFGEIAGILKEPRRYDGPMGKSDRAFFMGVVALILALGFDLGVWFNGLFILGIILGVITTYRRII